MPKDTSKKQKFPAVAKKITGRDVARVAGVSAQVVSAVFGRQAGNTRFSEAAKARVLAAAEELGFQPCMLGRSLRANRSFLVGVLDWDDHAWMTPSLLRGIQCGLREAGLTPLFLSQADEAEEAENLHALRRRQVDAFIVVPRQREPAYLELKNSGIPVVEIFNNILAGDGIPHTCQDMTSVGYMATRHLIGLGHRDIALLTHCRYRENWDARDHWLGYCRALAEAGLPERVVAHSLDRFVLGKVGSWHACTAEVEEKMLGRKRPTAAVCYDCWHAVYLIEAAARRRLRMPEALSLVGYHDWDICETITPAITTLEIDPLAMGHAAARQVVGLLTGRPVDNIQIPPRFIERTSTSQAPQVG